MSEYGSALATMVDTYRHAYTPSQHYDGVVSDFLNIPTTSPKQLKPQSKDFENDIINAYREDLRLMANYKDNVSDSYHAQRQTSKSRNKERIEQLLRKTGKTAMTASDSKYMQTLRSSQSGINSHGINKSNKELFSDDNLDNSENHRLGETDTIEKVINGDYEDDQNVNYYSIGNNRSFGVHEDTKGGITTPDISDPLIDPFYHKSEENLDMDYETARLHNENQNEFDLMNIQDYERIYDESDENINDRENTIDDGSFDNSQQMKRFLNTIKRPKKRIQDNLDSLTQEIMDDMQHVNDTENYNNNPDEVEDQNDALNNLENKQNHENDDNDAPEKIEFNNPSNSQDISLEMIQEETEHDTTKPRNSDMETPDRAKYASETILKEKAELESSINKELKSNKRSSNAQSEEIEKKREELMRKVVHSAYSSMSTFKRGLFESLDLNAGITIPS